MCCQPFLHTLTGSTLLLHVPGARAHRKMLYLPKRTLTLLDALCGALPVHTLLAANFDALPGTSLPGFNVPLVATTACCAPVLISSLDLF